MEKGYLDLLSNVLNNGQERIDRTGVGTISLFSPDQLRFDLTGNKLPLLTTKKVGYKTVIKELLWFLRGDTDANILKKQNVHIWDGNSSLEFIKSRNLEYSEGIIGAGYGFQFRHFGAEYLEKYADTSKVDTSQIGGFDQVKYIENLLKTDPFSRRIFMSTWNPKDLDKMTLPPCHISANFYVDNQGGLGCHMYQRSVDTFLGLPFNIASYALLTILLAKKCNLKPKELIISFGDVHIYKNHVKQVETQLKRCVYDPPTVKVDDSVVTKDYHEITCDDFVVCNYLYHPNIKAEMAI